mmetsp:Transcript_32631/g.23573  ORF Transcript_32631/g.23573 Transcript_32631/m.23573 type:complete len:122 (+) Transcript_32631:831-1196(+)
MFNPELLGIQAPGIVHMLFDSIKSCEIDLFLPLVQNIILTGGTTMFPGLSSRIEKDLKDLMTEKKYGGDASRVKKTGLTVHDPPRRKHSVFIGASFLAKRAPPQQWITKAEYEEKGDKVFM